MDKYKKEIEHYGMLYDYNDSEDYLRKHPHLACDDTANYLALWCINLEVQEVSIPHNTWRLLFSDSMNTHCAACVANIFLCERVFWRTLFFAKHFIHS